MSKISNVIVAISLMLSGAAIALSCMAAFNAMSLQDQFQNAVTDNPAAKSTSYIDNEPQGELSAKERATIGRIPCPPATVAELIEQGTIRIGKSEYTYVDDSILSLNVLASTVEGWHCDEDGVFKDGDGNIVCYSLTRAIGEDVETPLGKGHVYDCGGGEKTVGIFLHRDV